MSFYCVMVEGSGLALGAHEPASRMGFVKNEYVFASSHEAAKNTAKERVLTKLRRKNIDVGCADWIAGTGVDTSLKYWKILIDDGFIFFPDDENRNA